MNKFLLALYFAITPLMSFAATGLPVPGKVEDATVFPGLLGPSNYVANPIAWPSTANTNTPLNATCGRSTASGDRILTKSSWAIDASAQGGYCEFKLNPLGDEMGGGYCQVFANIKGDASLYSVQVMGPASTVKYTEKFVKNYSTNFGDFASVIFPCSKDYTSIRVTQTEAGTAPGINVGLFFGKATGLAQYATANFFGGMEQVGGGSCTYAENTSTGFSDYKDLGAGSGCNAWVVDQDSKGISAVGTNDHRINIASMPAGRYEFTIAGLFQSNLQACLFGLSDGSTLYQSQGVQDSGSGATGVPNMKFSVYVPSLQTSKTFKIQASDSGSNQCDLNNSGAGLNVSWKINYFPTSSQLAVSPNNAADLMGTIFYTEAATCPANSVLLDGSTLSTNYGPLISKRGSAVLPDLRGIFVRGAGSQTISGIAYSGTLGSVQNDQMQGHIHQVQGLNVQGGGSPTSNGGSSLFPFNTGGPLSDGTNGTPRVGAETRPANISLTPCMWAVSQPAPILLGGLTNNATSSGYHGTVTLTCGSSSSYSNNDDGLVASIANISGNRCAVTLNPVMSRIKGCHLGRVDITTVANYVSSNLNIVDNTHVTIGCTYGTGTVVACTGPDTFALTCDGVR